MRTRLILVQHGESWHRVRDVVGGPLGDTGLTDLGRSQAERLRDRLARAADLHGAALYSSTLPRTIETAEIIAPAIGATAPIQHCGLCTYHVSELVDGMGVDDFRRVHGLPGGGIFRPFEAENEAWAELLARVGRALWDIAVENAGGVAVAVAHGQTIAASLTALGDLPIRGNLDLRMVNTSLTEWITDDDLLDTGPPEWHLPRWSLGRLFDSAHLEGL